MEVVVMMMEMKENKTEEQNYERMMKEKTTEMMGLKMMVVEVGRSTVE